MENNFYVENTPFYLFDKCKFEDSIKDLSASFTKYYPKFKCCYSYKTNYTPAICKVANECGVVAEIVSGMEGYIAKQVGVKYDNIIFNGPYKVDIFEYLDNGSVIIIDNMYECKSICEHVKNGPSNKIYKVAFRLNYEMNPEKISRFGFDIHSDEVPKCIEMLNATKNIKIVGIHCHFCGARKLDDWIKRANTMIDYAFKHFNGKLEFIDLGSGMYGQMEEELAVQFSNNIPTFDDYGKAIGGLFSERFKDFSDEDKPFIYVEPGTTLVANAMNFYGKVKAMKTVRGKEFAIFDCSYHNIGCLTEKKNLPINVYRATTEHKDVNFVGYTCLESDVFYRNYTGKIDVGSVVEFRNCGSYSVTLKPPFILPNCAMYELDTKTGEVTLIKEKETYEDVLKTFKF